MASFLRVLWVFSSLFFLACNGFCYLKMPNSFDFLEFTISKKVFFYAMIGILAGTNLIILLFIKTLPLLPSYLLFVPKKKRWLEEKNSKILLFNWLRLLFKGFIIAINIFFALFVVWFLLYYLQWEIEFMQHAGLVLNISLALTGLAMLSWFFFIIFKLNFSIGSRT